MIILITTVLFFCRVFADQGLSFEDFIIKRVLYIYFFATFNIKIDLLTICENNTEL